MLTYVGVCKPLFKVYCVFTEDFFIYKGKWWVRGFQTKIFFGKKTSEWILRLICSLSRTRGIISSNRFGGGGSEQRLRRLCDQNC